MTMPADSPAPTSPSEAERLAREALARHARRNHDAGVESERDGIHYVGTVPLLAEEILLEMETGAALARALLASQERAGEMEKALHGCVGLITRIQNYETVLGAGLVVAAARRALESRP